MFDKDGGLLGNFDTSAKSSKFNLIDAISGPSFVPPSGYKTSAQAAQDVIDEARSVISNSVSKVVDPIISPANTGYVASDPDWSYLHSDLAQHYGMDKVTAYQESLANTSHQREVADLQAAGLNPVLSASGGNGSAVFGANGMSDAGAVISSGKSSGKGVASALVGLTTLLVTRGNFKAATAAASFTSVLEAVISG